jgi:hypothetical protein
VRGSIAGNRSQFQKAHPSQTPLFDKARVLSGLSSARDYDQPCQTTKQGSLVVITTTGHEYRWPEQRI